ncbi:aldo/keto reductase [Streptomyces sp. NPDC048270]|uniref:aldo/keto reductase n=1 Tax=Streptomyces sp. NPDC048270 TaxID=3154615 RepID=UPI00340517E6
MGTAIEQMHTLRQIGAIKAIGMRGPHPRYGASPAEQAAHAERFLYLFRLINPDVLWTPFNALTPAIQLEGENLFSFTARRGVGLILAAPLAHGLLTGNRARPGQQDWCTTSEAFTPRSLEAVASGLQVLREHFGSAPGTLTRLALRSALQRADHCIVVAGLTDERQANENFGCLGDALTDAELTLIGDVYARIRAGFEEASAQGAAQGVRV